MARRTNPESLRAEARRRGVSVYRVRADRAQSLGVSRRVAVGKPKPGERSLSERKARFPKPTPRRSDDPPQRYRYRYWIEGRWSYDKRWRFIGVHDSPRRINPKQLTRIVENWWEQFDYEELEERYEELELPQQIRVARITTA